MMQIVRFASVEDAPLFLPIIDGFSRTLQDFSEADGALDEKAWSDFQAALDDQVNIYSNPGAFSGGHDKIAVTVYAVRGGQRVDGYFVTVDIAGAVPKGRSSKSFALATSRATGRTGAGVHLIRVYSESGELVGKREVRIGRNGLEESFEVPID